MQKKKYSKYHCEGRRALWEADHVVPLVEGGPHTLANMRTLCVPCHKRATAELAARRAAVRKVRDEKQLPLSL